MSRAEVFGLLVIDKPAGPTSHDVVDEVRRVTGERRVGHTGTLDPAASGVLVLCLGTATRLAEYLSAADKRYLATVRFGAATDTYDAVGQITARSSLRPRRADLERALDAFRGAIRQRPPAYSAVKAGGLRAHRRARAGEAVVLPERDVVVHDLRLVEIVDAAPGDGIDAVRIDVHCSAGTYIRSIAHDLGQALGCGAHLEALRRTRSGAFGLDAAIDLVALERAARAGDLPALLLPPEAGLGHWPARVLDAAEQAALCSGRMVPANHPAPDAPRLWRAHAAGGAFVAVAELQRETGLLRPLKVFAPVGSTPRERS